MKLHGMWFALILGSVASAQAIRPPTPPEARVSPAPSATSWAPASVLPFCANSIKDRANPASCIRASSVPTLGQLYPLSSELFVDASSGDVGIGTTSPIARLHVDQVGTGVSFLVESADVSSDVTVLNDLDEFAQFGNNNSSHPFAGMAFLWQYADNHIRIGTDNTERMRVWNTGTVQVFGSLVKGSGSFRIDHPLDPENKYLSHSFVESPDMMNIYNGNVVLGPDGTATVQLPDWFEALNRDHRYQLTCIGGHAPVYIAAEIEGGRFEIGGGTAGLKVSWQVTGIRKDKFAEANRIQVEQLKPDHERGTYLHPEVHRATAPSRSIAPGN